MAALVVGCLAIIGTSPAQLSVEIPIKASGTVELTSETPVAVVPVTVRASDEALWPADPEITLHDAWIVFVFEMPGVARHANAESPVRLSLVPIDPSAASDEVLASSKVDLARLCPQDQDCELRYNLVLEWMEPVRGESMAVGWAAEGRVMLSGTEQLPLDATAGVDADDPQVRSVATLSDRLSEDGITLSVDQPLATRHIVFEATADAVPAAVEYPLEGWGMVTIDGIARGEQPVRSPGFAVTLVPDPDTPAEAVPDQLLGARTPFNPFAGCAAEEPCRRGYTLRLEWISDVPGATIDVSWHMDARLTFHEGPGPGESATVTVEQDGAWSASADSPALTASHAGRLDVPEDDPGIAQRRTIWIRLNPDAVPLTEPIAGGPPAVAIVTMQAGSNRDFGDEPPSLLVSVEYPASAPPGALSPDALIGGEPARVAILPLRGCEQGQPCEVAVTIGAGVSANDLKRVAGADLWLDWELDIRLPYVSLDAVPPGAAIDISDD